MRSLSTKMLGLCVVAAVCLPVIVLAGGGPENLLLVVNADSTDSLAVANEYVSLRRIPPSNVVYLTGLPAAPGIKVADFKDKILRPVLDTIKQRGLDGQIDYIVYSAGFPFAIDVSEDMAGKQFPRFVTQPASLTGMTYFRDLVLAADPTYLAADANWYARGAKPQEAGSEPVDPRKAADAVQATLQTLLAQLQELRKTVPDAKPPFTAEKIATIDHAIATVQAQTTSRRANAAVLYDEACVMALQGINDQAMLALTAAFQAGWANGSLTEADTDLTSLRDRADFKALVAKMREVIMIPDPPQPFHSATAWDRQGAPATSPEARRYMISVMLAYTGGPANTLPEALQCLRTSASADGTSPRGTIYFMASSDWARTGPRQWLFQSAVQALARLGVRGEAVAGWLPVNKPDVAGCVVGAAGLKWKDSGSTLLPGAFCDHLTSFAGVMTGTDQTLLSEWIRYGAAGSAGTVTEPYNIPVKFPTPFLHVYYASGCSLAEAFYLSTRAPYQQLLVGDPLCRPWAKIPQVRVANLKADQVVRKPLRLSPTSSPAGTPVRYELFVDGVRRESCADGRSFVLDPGGFAEGYHEARIVAIAGPVETQGRLVVPFRVGARQIVVQGWPTGPVAPEAALRLTASLPGAQRIAFLQNAREIAAIDGGSGTVEVPVARLGLGPVVLQAVARLGDGHEVYGPPQAITVAAKASG
jgi:hypothetical protein